MPTEGLKRPGHPDLATSSLTWLPALADSLQAAKDLVREVAARGGE
jgi:hypothetical protein